MTKSTVACSSRRVLTAVIFLVSILCVHCQSTSSTTTGWSSKDQLGDDESGVDFHDSFRTITRRSLLSCHDLNPYLKLTLDTAGPLSDVQTVTVNVSGVLDPSDDDWIGVISPSNTNISDCAAVKALYLATGDTASMPLLCHYPVKFQYVKNDPGYLPCTNSKCQVPPIFGDNCTVTTCSGSIAFELINIRTDISFVLFTGGLDVPCILETAGPLSFANPNSPLYGHISSVDSSGTSMRLTWVSGDADPQTVQYASGSTNSSTVSTFTSSDMCTPGAASDVGWHDPGYIHTAVMTGLLPSTQYAYQYGSTKVGFSANATFTTPPATGDDALSVIVYGDMGKAERDGSLIHYIQPGALAVIDAVTKAVNNGTGVDFIFHIGDISYATGYLVEWENFLDIIQPVASQVSYMTAVGNHERDNPHSGSYYDGADSGGECGIPYYYHFQMPTVAQDKPWYSIESGPVHFTIVSTEHNFTAGTEQYTWIQTDLASVNRSKTPWLIFSGHRPFYTSLVGSIINDLEPSADPDYSSAIEPLLLNAKVDLSLAGHVHNYERTCAVYQGNCLQNAAQNSAGVDTFDFSTYPAPVQVVAGMSGFTLDGFKSDPDVWSSVRISDFGYTSIEFTRTSLLFTFTYANGTVGDSFAITK